MVLLSGFVFSFLLEKRREVRDDAGLTAWNSATHPFKRCQLGNMLSGAKDLAFERHWTTLSLETFVSNPQAFVSNQAIQNSSSHFRTCQ
jgi:hypothetical protein